MAPPDPAYDASSYDTKARLASYWHQVDEAVRLGAKTVLMIGHGSGLASLMLQRRGVRVLTLDIDPALQPGVVGDVRALPCADRSVDVALCCQVLEHLPFRQLIPALRELRRVARVGLVLSLPDQGRSSRLLAVLLKRRHRAVSLPTVWPRVWEYNGQHYWQVNAKGYALERIEAAIREAGWRIAMTYRPLECPYHRFWRLV